VTGNIVNSGTQDFDELTILGDLTVGNNMVADGTVTAQNFFVLSDKNLKSDISQDTREIQKSDAEKLAKVNVSQYSMLLSNSNKRKKGVIAQEFAELFPEAIEATQRKVRIPGTVTLTSNSLLIQTKYAHLLECGKVYVDGTLVHVLGTRDDGDTTIVTFDSRLELFDPKQIELIVDMVVNVVDYEYILMIVVNAMKHILST
jgi:hypothetical protein